MKGQENDSHSSSNKSNDFKTAVRERDDNRCVLSGEIDEGHQVAHFIPQSLMVETRDEDERNLL